MTASHLVGHLAGDLHARGMSSIFLAVPKKATPFSDVDIHAYGPMDAVERAFASRADIFGALGTTLVSWTERRPRGGSSIGAVFDLKPAPLKIDVVLENRELLRPHPLLRNAELLYDDTQQLAQARKLLIRKPPSWETNPVEVGKLFDRFYGYSWTVLSKICKGEGEWVIVDGLRSLFHGTILPLYHACYQLEQPGLSADLLDARERFGGDLIDALRTIPLGFDRDTLFRAYASIYEIFERIAHLASRRFGVPYPRAAEAALRATIAKASSAQPGPFSDPAIDERRAIVDRVTRDLEQRGVVRAALTSGARPHAITPFSDVDLVAFAGADLLDRVFKSGPAMFSPHAPVLACWSNRFDSGERSINVLLDAKPAPLKLDIALRPDTAPSIEPPARRETTPSEVEETIHRFFGRSWSALSKIHKDANEWFLIQGLSSLINAGLLPLHHAVHDSGRTGEPDLLYARERLRPELHDALRCIPLGFDRDTQARACSMILELVVRDARSAAQRYQIAYPEAAELALRTLIAEHFGRPAR